MYHVEFTQRWHNNTNQTQKKNPPPRSSNLAEQRLRLRTRVQGSLGRSHFDFFQRIESRYLYFLRVYFPNPRNGQSVPFSIVVGEFVTLPIWYGALFVTKLFVLMICYADDIFTRMSVFCSYNVTNGRHVTECNCVDFSGSRCEICMRSALWDGALIEYVLYVLRNWGWCRFKYRRELGFNLDSYCCRCVDKELLQFM